MRIRTQLAELARNGHWKVPEPGRNSQAEVAAAAVVAVNESSGENSSSSDPDDISSRALIVEPVREGGRDVLLFFVPGALTPAESYLPLADAVQAASLLRLWIVIFSSPGDYVSSAQVDCSFDGVMARVKEKGFGGGGRGSHVFLGGHSYGAWESRAVALRRAEGFVQIGSCFWGGSDNLAQYPKPVLTIVGELDGQITLAAAVAHAGQILETESELGEHNSIAIKPVVVIRGMNHAQASHGIPNKERGDLEAEISLEEARCLLGEVISSFLTVNSGRMGEDESGEWERCMSSLRRFVRATEASFQCFYDVIKKQEEGPKQWQVQVAGRIPGLAAENVSVVKHDFLDNFIYSMPGIDVNRQRILVHFFLQPLNLYAIVHNIWVKMKSSEAVSLVFGPSQTANDDLTLAASFNKATFTRALELVPEESRQKFITRGRQLNFIHDKLAFASALDWIQDDVTIQAASDGSAVADVQSPVIVTPPTGLPHRFTGMHCMKLLTVARAMQWILVDAFR